MKSSLVVILSLFAFFLSCQKAPKTTPQTQLSLINESGSLQVKKGKQTLLGYQYEMKYPPAGVDSIFARSGFIHPLNTPAGKTLTRIQPEDHYHHYGIWNPWTHVLFEGDTIDFWNLKKGHGTVRFNRFNYKRDSSDFVEFQVVLNHVIFRDTTEIIALSEIQTIKVQSLDSTSYLVDFTIDMQCATQSPFLILEYRYGGFGWRTTEEWHKGNSEVFTDLVDTRDEVDGTTGRWCLAQGTLGDDFGGVVLMSHPDNFNHPEPLRVWPTEDNQRGDLFINIAPTKNRDWLLEPGQTYTLKYQLLVFDHKKNRDQAESAWQTYTNVILP